MIVVRIISRRVQFTLMCGGGGLLDAVASDLSGGAAVGGGGVPAE